MEDGANPDHEIDLNGLPADSLDLVKMAHLKAEYAQVSNQRSAGNGMQAVAVPLRVILFWKNHYFG